MIWLAAYDESRAIRDVKRGQVSPSRNTLTFQTIFEIQCLKVCFFRLSLAHLKDTPLEKHRLTFKKMVKFFIANSIGLLSSLPSNRTCWMVFILIFMN